jgi:hypothetical protein
MYSIFILGEVMKQPQKVGRVSEPVVVKVNENEVDGMQLSQCTLH